MKKSIQHHWDFGGSNASHTDVPATLTPWGGVSRRGTLEKGHPQGGRVGQPEDLYREDHAGSLVGGGPANNPIKCTFPGCGKKIMHVSSFSRHLKGVHNVTDKDEVSDYFGSYSYFIIILRNIIHSSSSVNL